MVQLAVSPPRQIYPLIWSTVLKHGVNKMMMMMINSLLKAALCIISANVELKCLGKQD